MDKVFFRKQIHVAATLIHYGAVAFVAAYAKGWKVPVVMSWNEWNENPEKEDEFAITTYFQKCFSEDNCESTQANVKLMVMFFSIISGTHHLFACLPYFKEMYEKIAIEGGVNYYRWTDYAFSSGLMIVVNTFLLKTPADFATVIPTFLVQFMVCIGGAASEYAWAKGYIAGAKAIFILFFLPFIVLWASQFVWLGYSAHHSTNRYPECETNKELSKCEGMPAFVWAYFFVLFAGFALFPIIHSIKIGPVYKGSEEEKDLSPANRDNLPEKKYLCIVAENRYAAASITAKVPLLLLFSVSLERDDLEFSQGSEVTPDMNYNPVADDTTIFIVVGASLVACLIVGLIFSFIDPIMNFFERKNCCKPLTQCCSDPNADKPRKTKSYQFTNASFGKF